MAQASRTFEVERPVEAVWRVYSDFEVWASWFDFNILIATSLHRFFWQGAPGPGTAISVEINGVRQPDWQVKEWDPPLRYKVGGLNPGFGAFVLGLSLTKQTDVSTVVDFKLTGVPLTRVARFLMTDGSLARRLDSMVQTANQRFTVETA